MDYSFVLCLSNMNWTVLHGLLVNKIRPISHLCSRYSYLCCWPVGLYYLPPSPCLFVDPRLSVMLGCGWCPAMCRIQAICRCPNGSQRHLSLCLFYKSNTHLSTFSSFSIRLQPSQTTELLHHLELMMASNISNAVLSIVVTRIQRWVHVLDFDWFS